MKKIGFIAMMVLVTVQAANAMIPGPPRVVECPGCGEQKRLLSLISGNTFGATQWSDLYMETAMLPRVSQVQKCHGCGGYFSDFKLCSLGGLLREKEGALQRCCRNINQAYIYRLGCFITNF